MGEIRSAHHIEIGYLLSELRERGVSLTGVEAGIRQFVRKIEKGESCSSAELQAGVAYLLDLIPDDGVGLRVGSKVGVKDYGAFGHAYLSSRNMRSVHELILAYRRILRTLHEISIEYGDESFSFSIVNMQATGMVKKFFVEAWLMLQHKAFEELLGEDAGFDRVCLDFEAPPYADVYRSIFGCPVTFEQATNCYQARNRLLDLPFSYANEDVRQFCEQQCLQVMRAMDAGEETVTRAREMLLRSPGWFPTCDELAARMGFSARTLRRRLQQEGSSFQEVIDSLRMELSLNYLRTTDLTVELIALRLGYEEANSFYKAFRRWYGTSPKAFVDLN